MFPHKIITNIPHVSASFLALPMFDSEQRICRTCFGSSLSCLLQDVTHLDPLQGAHLHPLVSETDPVGLGFTNLAAKQGRKDERFGSNDIE